MVRILNRWLGWNWSPVWVFGGLFVFRALQSCHCSHLPIRPSLLNSGDGPQLMNVLRQFFSNTFQMRRQHNLHNNKVNKPTRETKKIFTYAFVFLTNSQASTWTVSTGQGVKEVWVRDRVGPRRLRTPSKSCLYSLIGSMRILSLGSTAS